MGRGVVGAEGGDPNSLPQGLPAPASVSRPLPGTGCHLGRAHVGTGASLLNSWTPVALRV